MDRLHTSLPENPQFARQNALIGLAVTALEHAVNMEDKAMVDPLTGLYNTRALEHSYDRLTMPSPGLRKTDDKTEILSEPNSLLYIDIDKFKLINDTEGHAFGDGVLCQSAEILEDRTRGTCDLPVRFSGDELGALLAGASEKDALLVAKDILEQMNDRGIKASIGVMQIDPFVTLAENLEDADSAMYEAKGLGGNRAVAASHLADKMLPFEPPV